jgi:uncharacterized repeat protein (TIGR03803 family)
MTKLRLWVGVPHPPASPYAYEFFRVAMVAFFAVVFAIVAPAQNLTTLATFDETNGADPVYMSMVQATDGTFYGTTSVGGTYLAGVVFRLTAQGSLSTIYSFCNESQCAYSSNPNNVIQALDGNLYGTTRGNLSCNSSGMGCGTVYKLTTGGRFKVLYTFCSQLYCADGAVPQGSLVQGTDGNFYGTTYTGGNDSCNSNFGPGCGTVFKITPQGKLTTIYSFCSVMNCDDGTLPTAGLIQAVDGNFYGTTINGGTAGVGTIFKISPAGTLTTLYSFCSQKKCADGETPGGALAQGSDGNLYGTTLEGGQDGCGPGGYGCGTIFKLTTDGTFTTLHAFNFSDGYQAITTLVQATDVQLYGTTFAGGTNNNSLCKMYGGGGCGTVFRVTTQGTLTTLYNFCSQTGCTDGMSPSEGLLQATNGSFYGSTTSGGDPNCVPPIGCGTLFSEAVGLVPFVMTRPTSGMVGQKVIILGNNLKGTTSVAFHGMAAKFTVVSSSEITATVPTGATTGKVKVKARSGTLVSSVIFRVKK